jgi:hypothetical protein
VEVFVLVVVVEVDEAVTDRVISDVEVDVFCVILLRQLAVTVTMIIENTMIAI